MELTKNELFDPKIICELDFPDIRVDADLDGDEMGF